MKKLCILLAMILALSGVPALASEGDAILGRDENNPLYFNQAFVDGDTLYLESYDALYTWHPGDEALRTLTYDKPQIEGDNYEYAVVPFLCDGQLYAVTLLTTYEERSSFEGAKLCALTIQADDTVSFEELRDVDWDNLVEYYDQDSYAMRPQSIVAASGKAYLRHYNSQYDYVVSVLDLNTGRMEEIDALNDAFAMCAYRDGTLLVEQYSYRQSDVARLLVYDPEDDSTQTVCELQIADYSPLPGLAYDAESDTVYCVKGGEICPIDLASGEVGEGVNNMPMEGYSDASGCVLAGGYYAGCADGAVVRNLNPTQRAEIRLKICDGAYSSAITTAYNRFAGEHGDVNVVLSRDYTEAQNLIEDMMNRSDSVDIYTLYVSSSVFDALYKRGYLMELESETLDALAEHMYSSLREKLSSGGHLVALPVGLDGWTMGFNEKALEALGLTLQDVPDNWWDLLDFLKGLEGKISQTANVSLEFPDYTVSDVRNELFYSLFSSYQTYVNAVDPAMGYDTPLLRGLMEKLDALDFVALGCAEDRDDYNEEIVVSRAYEYGPEEPNMLMHTYVGCSFGDFYSDFTPVWMGLDADTRAPLVLETTVAFVNPFTRHPETALAFMDRLAESLPNTVRYNIDPSLNEVIRGAENEEMLEQLRQDVERQRAALEDAEPAEKQMLEENLANLEQSLEYVDKYAWDVRQEDLDWYRANAENLLPAPVNWLYADESGEAWQLMSQYREGSIGIDEMLKGIDRKVQMMLMEGN